MTGARRSSAQTSRLNSVISRIGEVATTEAVRKPPIATSGGADQSGGEISTAISPTTSPAPIVPTVLPLMMTSAVPLSMAYSEYPTRPSAASNCPGGISDSDAMFATAASSSSGKSAKMRIPASRNVSISPRLHSGSHLRDLAPSRFTADHTPLGAFAVITAGAFHLATRRGGTLTAVTGEFTAGRNDSRVAVEDPSLDQPCRPTL